MGKIKSDDIGFLKTVRFFHGWQDADLKWFIENAEQVDYSRHNILVERGDAADHIFIILWGWVKLYHIDANGEEKVLELLTRGDSFGETSIQNDSEYPYSAQLVGGDGRCLVISATSLREKIYQTPEIAIKMIAALARHINQSALHFDLLNRLNAVQKLAAFLLKLSWDRGGTAVLQLPYKKNLVAARLDIEPETFSRALHTLAQLGIIEKDGRQITICTPQKLMDASGLTCLKTAQCTQENHDPHCDFHRLRAFF